ncbi:DUF3298 and DUF4163 domain-containing protein [Flavobacterium tegetincola]|uniref:DUF3298 and DUF4163 domain-containing protein n=1 Tax=Flavobacterium tegetincola TaxID=150172 RepID=UPI0004006E03|nr:DUF3298 and DUF4163 domain-containing protein [Flavobacterium tegetincola]
MKKITFLFAVAILFISCKNDKQLEFTTETYTEKSTLPCTENCPVVEVKVPIAKNVPVVADSINKRVFAVVSGIIYFGEKPYTSTEYTGLLQSFISSYDALKKEFPKDTFGWEGKVEGSVVYETENVLNIKIDHYTYTGGAHGYQGVRSLIFNPKTGKIIPNEELFNDVDAFTKFAEQKFRTAYKISESDAINSTGLMFEDEKFALPMTMLFNEKGLLLYYNSYEAASYADGPKEIQLTYSELEPYLKVK